MQIRLHPKVEPLLKDAAEQANKSLPTVKQAALRYRKTTPTELANEILFMALRRGKMDTLASK